jgi:DnaD/phage-associated family protein
MHERLLQMNFEIHKSLYSDTLLPDIFITEYMPALDGDCVKVDLYCLYLSKHNKHASTEEMSKVLVIDREKVKQELIQLEALGAINRMETGITLVDLKEKEIRKMYRMKTTSTPEEALQNSEKNKKRNEIVTAINNTFFQGLMSPSWYTDIDAWFDRYKFDEDVMLALFHHCSHHKGLTKNYIAKVADNWYSKNIKNSFDLDNYSIEYQKFKDVKSKTIKKLKLSRNLTEYEDEFVEKWVMEYGYCFDIIELALRKTTAKTNPNFNYLNTIISDWHKNGLKTKEEIAVYDKEKKESMKQKQSKGTTTVPQRGNFKQRQYDDKFFDSLYENK